MDSMDSFFFFLKVERLNGQLLHPFIQGMGDTALLNQENSQTTISNRAVDAKDTLNWDIGVRV